MLNMILKRPFFLYMTLIICSGWAEDPVPGTWTWIDEDWSVCSVPCGGALTGRQIRDRRCDGPNQCVDGFAWYDPGDTNTRARECPGGYVPCKGKWSPVNWFSCSDPCGGKREGISECLGGPCDNYDDPEKKKFAQEGTFHRVTEACNECQTEAPAPSFIENYYGLRRDD